MADKAILVPTAEEDAAIHLTIFPDFFTLPAGILFLTPEEQDLVGKVALGDLPPSEIIGFAVDVPAALDPDAFRAKHRLDNPLPPLCRPDRPQQGLRRAVPLFQEYLKREHPRRRPGPGRDRRPWTSPTIPASNTSAS